MNISGKEVLRLAILTLLFSFSFFGGGLFAQTWNQVDIDIDGESIHNNAGQSVSMSNNGSIVAIGAPFNDGNGQNAGHVRVYELGFGVWTQLGADIDGEAEQDRSGTSVSLSADGLTLAVGAYLNSEEFIFAGHVRVYKFIAGVWTQLGADIDGGESTESAGWAVSLSDDGSIVAIGANLSDSNGIDAGTTRVYQFASGTWTQFGASINGEAAGDRSGRSVSLSADGLTVAIGANSNSGNGANAGHVRVYQFISETWIQLGEDIDGEAAGDYSGDAISLSADGLTLAIGSVRNTGNGFNAGHTRVYKFISGTWMQLGADLDSEAASDQSGFSVSLSADGLIVAIGAVFNNGNGSGAGHVRVYKFISGTWVQQGADIDGEMENDFSGRAVSLSADGLTIAIGAHENTGNGIGAGHTRIYEFSLFTSVLENSFGTAINFYPNPTNGDINIAFEQVYSNLNVQVRNILGQLVYSNNFGATNQIAFEIEGASGLYFIEATTTEGRSAQLKVMKK